MWIAHIFLISGGASLFFPFSFVFCSPYLSIYLRFFFVLLSLLPVFCIYLLYGGGASFFQRRLFFSSMYVTRRAKAGLRHATLRYVTLRLLSNPLAARPTHKNTNKKIKNKNKNTPTPHQKKMSRVAISLANAVLRVRVRVRANAAETRILAVREERVDIAVTAPAREGAAGKGVVAVVSKVCCTLFGWGEAEMGEIGSRSPAQHGAHCVGHEGAG